MLDIGMDNIALADGSVFLKRKIELDANNKEKKRAPQGLKPGVTISQALERYGRDEEMSFAGILRACREMDKTIFSVQNFVAPFCVGEKWKVDIPEYGEWCTRMNRESTYATFMLPACLCDTPDKESALERLAEMSAGGREVKLEVMDIHTTTIRKKPVLFITKARIYVPGYLDEIRAGKRKSPEPSAEDDADVPSQPKKRSRRA